MKVIISICAGIICLAVSNDIGTLISQTLFSLILDILGGILIGIGCKFYFDQKKSERKEIEVNFTQIIESIEKTSATEHFNDIIAEIRAQSKSINELLAEVKHISADQVAVEKLKSNTVELKNHIEEYSKTVREHLVKITDNLDNLKSMPQELIEIEEGYQEKFTKQYEELIQKLKDIPKDIEEQEDKQKKSLDKVMKEIRDNTDEYNDCIKESIEQLGNQYKQFEEMSKAMIEQMTGMAEKDYEALKELLKWKS